MAHIRRFPAGLLVLAACLFLAGTSAAGVGIQAYSGDTVPLSGYSPTSNTVYLFLTGPNLPVNGVALNDITKRADQGGFTTVSVTGEDDSWSYKWHTNSLNGHLDDGTYTIWVVNSPSDRSNLQNAEYATISVTLGSPTISVNSGVTITPVTPASFAISSEPNESSVSINGQYRGKTPLVVDNLKPGTYEVAVSKFGYTPYSDSINLGSGEQGVVRATLPAERGTIIVNSTPAGARVSLDGADAGISPVTLPNVLPGNHTVALALDGYVPFEQQVAVTAGTTSPLEIQFTPVSIIPTLPVKAPGLLAGTLVGLMMAAVLLSIRPRSR
ncbi:PEGA domain-containing protein [Methanoregula sp.]|uniref:PEGA domain-containing protein n=1 Tax=Methanoregula sp. TaxID=2052170 RepID=UPI0023695E99|nr:PEGA domain-containing protein [Methanoregula sp.]MDD1685847.1 PEGA domain-containing protein [Methanoregula sp.]